MNSVPNTLTQAHQITVQGAAIPYYRYLRIEEYPGDKSVKSRLRHVMQMHSLADSRGFILPKTYSAFLGSEMNGGYMSHTTSELWAQAKVDPTEHLGNVEFCEAWLECWATSEEERAEEWHIIGREVPLSPQGLHSPCPVRDLPIIANWRGCDPRGVLPARLIGPLA